MDFLLRRVHPVDSFLDWKRKRQEKCLVRILYPRMKIIGKLRQSIADDADYKPYFAFMGIPYAKPPVGDLRFQPPEDLDEYDPMFPHTVKGYSPGNRCLQIAHDGLLKKVGCEDCLYLNIYIAKKPKNVITKLPVLVYIHGANFDHGSGDIHNINPDTIMQEKLVFVTINYRLGVFGFLNMGTEDCRGNAGLKDQVMALKWIKKNIDKFGGDPKNVTIQGYGAGGTCVNLHMISVKSIDLFHRAIVHGGGIYCPWGFLRNQKTVKRLFTRATKTDLDRSVVRTLKSEEANKLLDIATRIKNDVFKLEKKRMTVFLGPSKEPIPKNAFLPYDIEKIKKYARPKPLMAGICKGAGYLYILGKYHKYVRTYKSLVENDDEFKTFLEENFHWDEESAVDYMDEIRAWYFPDLPTMSNFSLRENLANLMTDIWFRRFYDNFKMGMKPKPFYVFQFSYLGLNDEHRMATGRGHQPEDITLAAPCQGDDIYYLYDPNRFKLLEGGKLSMETKRIMKILCKAIAIFCRAGDYQSRIFIEGQEWKPHSDGEQRYLNIDYHLEVVEGRINEERWRRFNEMVAGEPVVESP